MKLVNIERNDMGRLKYTLKLSNGRTIEFGGITISEILYKGNEIEVADDVYLGEAVYYEFTEDWDLDNNLVYDVYEHQFVEGYNGLEIGDSKLIGTWKTEKTAMKHFNRLNSGR